MKKKYTDIKQIKSARQFITASTGIVAILLFVFTACNNDDEGPVIELPEIEISECTEDAQLIFEEGFESGMLELKPSGNAPEVVEVADARHGNYVMKSQLTPHSTNTYRTEVSLNKDELFFKPGEEYWVGLSTKLGEDFGTPSGFNDQGMLFQWHYVSWNRPEVKDAQPLVGRYRNGNVDIQCEMVGYLATTPGNVGEWVDWVIHVKFDNEDGLFKVWRNGVQVLDWTGDNHIEEMVEGAYMKFGLYSAQYKETSNGTLPEGQTRTVYHDEVRIAGADGCYDLVAPPSDKLKYNKILKPLNKNITRC